MMVVDKTIGTYLVNDAQSSLRYGEVNLINPPRRERRGLPEEDRQAMPYCDRWLLRHGLGIDADGNARSVNEKVPARSEAPD